MKHYNIGCVHVCHPLSREWCNLAQYGFVEYHYQLTIIIPDKFVKTHQDQDSSKAKAHSCSKFLYINMPSCFELLQHFQHL